MKNMKISMKLIVSFLIMIILIIIINIVGIWGMNSMKKGAADLYEYDLTAITAIADLRELFNKERNDIRAIFLAENDPVTVNKLVDNFVEYDKAATYAFMLYETTITDNKYETAYYAAKEIYLGSYAKMKKEIFDLVKSGDFNKAFEIFSEGTAAIGTPLLNGFAESTENSHTRALDNNNANKALYRTLTLILCIILVAACIIALLLSFYVSGLISKPLILLNEFMNKAVETGDIKLRQEDIDNISRLSQVNDEIGQSIMSCAKFVNRISDIEKTINTVAGGDLTVQISLLSDKDTMGLSLNKMLNNLNKMFAEINASSAQVLTGANQVSNGSQSLAQGSTEQASSAEQLSSSINEIAVKTKQNAEMANEAASLSAVIRNDAEMGKLQMDRLMQAVIEINDASQSISKVIKVIDDIAFQTNILALNAAVEAARAGTAGKGFAVVAEEVRNLASKSAEAANDTSSMIENSREKSNLGLSIATNTAASLNEIVNGIIRSADIIARIAQSSDEQSTAISQINTGIEQVSTVIQQNSAIAEESAAASEEMNAQASFLQELINQFKVKKDNMGYSTELPALLHSERKHHLTTQNTAYRYDDFEKY